MSCEVVLQNVILSKHIFNTFLAFLNFNFFLRNCRLLNLLVDNKSIVGHFTFWIALGGLFRILFWFFKTAVFGVAHIAIGRCLGIGPDDDVSGLVFFAFLYVGSLNWKISTFFAFSLILFAGYVDLTDDFLVQSKILLPLLAVFLLVLNDGHVQHPVLNV